MKTFASVTLCLLSCSGCQTVPTIVNQPPLVECDRPAEAKIPTFPNVASPDALAKWALAMVSAAENERAVTQAHQGCMAQLREEGVIR